jgi:hypothetical protein
METFDNRETWEETSPWSWLERGKESQTASESAFSSFDCYPIEIMKVFIGYENCMIRKSYAAGT